MILETKIPTVGESINEVTLSKWYKNDGDLVQQDDLLCEIESEKASFELNAEKAGKLKIVAAEGSVIKIGEVVCTIDTDAAVAAESPAKEEKKAEAKTVPQPAKQEAPSIAAVKEPATQKAPTPTIEKVKEAAPAANGKGKSEKNTKTAATAPVKPTEPKKPFSRNERREKMSNLRKAVAKHLVAAKNQTAMLTTFNEVDMKVIMDIRAKYKDSFKEKNGVNLGFMSFFTKSVTNALNEWQAINAFIDGEELVYHDYCDIGIAVSTPKGLTVPVIRNAESLSIVEIEQKVADLGKRGRDNKLTPDEMNGGTFTISNGGVFGSLLSTPILNSPQSAILGMHKIQDRPVVIDGQVVVRPMMYLALSYDHRIIDGHEAVSFLVRIKEQLEHPEQLVSGSDPVKNLLGL
jgi:2-oxoglutarate dehydrogenase E2 component (dihydrolipoamide succinyltransferase)